ncbi:MAG: enoyl-CoA hydratase [Myxococcales bacterium]|nr:MAG: enoyl-CoA hydratase [Myxococcales bacterium]
MTQGKTTTERRGHVFLMGIDRVAKRNAFDIAMYQSLGLALGELDRDPELRCGVLFAHGPHFTAGLDLAEWAAIMSAGRFPDMPEGACEPMGLDEAARVRKPLVMAVQGICFTIGLELLLATDIRVAASDLRMAQIEVKRGFYAVGGGTVRLIQEVGWGNAMRYLLTGDEITAEAALRLGLVQDVVEPGKQLDRAIEIAETIAEQAPLGVQATLASARLARAQGEPAANARLLPDLIPLMATEDMQEGFRSFMERRKATFSGR